MADFADRSLGIGYTGGSSLLLLCLLAVLGLWYWSQGSISVDTVSTPKVEAFYWAAITFSQTLGTALGDWMADTGGPRLRGRRAGLRRGLGRASPRSITGRSVSRVLLFWAAFILTRPLGATVGDFLDKPINHGGLALSRPLASAVIAAFIVGVPARAAATGRQASGTIGNGRVIRGAGSLNGIAAGSDPASDGCGDKYCVTGIRCHWSSTIIRRAGFLRVLAMGSFASFHAVAAIWPVSARRLAVQWRRRRP